MTYGMKTVMQMPITDDLSVEQDRYLTVNGQRLAHASRSF